MSPADTLAGIIVRLDQTPDDAALVRRILNGDPDAWAILYHTYKGVVWRIASSMVGPQDAEDVVQETFAKLFRRIRHFDPELGTLKWYISAIARNAAKDCLRARSRLARQLTEEMIQTIEAASEREPEGLEEVRRCLELFPDELGRKIFRLRLKLKNDKEIAAELRIAPSTVRAYKSQVYAFIRETMRTDQQNGAGAGMS